MAYHHGDLRRALLERAAEVVTDRGIDALSLRGLARDLGVSHAAPSRHFPDRQALLAELAKEGFRRVVAAMNEGAEAAGPDPIRRYRALGRSVVRFAVSDPAFYRAMVHAGVRASADRELRELEAAWFKTLRAGVVAAQAAGWHPEASEDALVAFSISGALGAASFFADPHWRALIDAPDFEGLADDVLGLVVERTAAPEAKRAADGDPGDRESTSPSASASTPSPEEHPQERRAS